MRSVSGDSAIASEPKNISPSPWPMASGLPRRAPIIRSSSPSNRMASANAPSSRPSAASTACSGVMPSSRLRVTRWAMTSVSVSVSNRQPSAISSSFSSRKFSMMPLWTSASRCVACGWALVSVGLPCVAQRVWPMPERPASGDRSSLSSRFRSLPSARRRVRWPSSSVATPGRVVAAIFEPLQRVEQERRRRPRTQYPDDPAHVLRPIPSLPQRRRLLACRGRAAEITCCFEP